MVTWDLGWVLGSVKVYAELCLVSCSVMVTSVNKNTLRTASTHTLFPALC